MLNENISIKQEFDNNFKTLEENAKKKTQFLNAMLMTLGVCLFIAVSIGTLLSYTNYIKSKDKNNKTQVIELKSMN